MTFAANVRVDDLTDPRMHALLREHMAGMLANSPIDSVHALDLSGLKVPEITFWTAWDGDELLACGALKELDKSHGEIKSMRTAAKHLRKGAARAILETIIATARNRGYQRLSLETGSTEAFMPALTLYEKFGFEFCGPFAQYKDDPFSRFMCRSLEP
jgi:putative acetyltransferase